jgi:erythromycin esterase-like protein
VYVGTDGVPDGLSNTRDETMADEVTRLAGRADAPVAVWAHDSHLDRQRRRPTVDHVDPSPSAGSFLADRFGDDYVLVRFSLGAGAVTAVTETDEGSTITSVAFDGPTPGTVEATLEAAVDGPALFDVRVDDAAPDDAAPSNASRDERAAADPATEWLTTPHDHFAVGATFDGDPTERLATLAPARATAFWWHLPEVSPTSRLATEE